MTHIHNEIDNIMRAVGNSREAATTLLTNHEVLTRFAVDEWADAKFARDFERADRIREVLRSIGVEPLMGTKYYNGALRSIEGGFVYEDLPKHVVGNPVGNTWRYIA